MRPDSSKLLLDALPAADRISAFVRGRDYLDFAGDILVKSAVERQFTILGEALSQLRQSDRDTAERVSNLGVIIAFRNRLVHGYAALDDRVVWSIIEDDLDVLREDLKQLLRDLDAGAG